MRCEKHTSDLTSTFAVCATCLRERLQSLLQAQAQAQDQARLARVISRATGESSTNSSEPDSNSTSHVGSTFYRDGKRWKKSLRKFWNFSDLFRSRSEKLRSDQSCESSSPASPSWFSKVLPDRRKNRDRFGMLSPARGEIFAGECNQTSSSSGCSSDSTPRWRRTLPDAAATKSTRRSRLGVEKSETDSGMAFCLSPLVRLNHNGLPPEIAAVVVKPHLSAAASFCTNRSRKLADFGKVNTSR